MKKVLSCLLAGSMLFALASCNDNGNNAPTDYYQIAVDNGYTGTEAQFIEDISSLGVELGSGVKEVNREGNTLKITLHDGTVFEVDLTANDGEDGKDGETPYIGKNGNWWIGDKDTGVLAEDKTEYTVYLNEDYGKFNTEIKVKKGNCVDLPTPKREGYVFAGWYTGAGANDKQFTSYDPVLCDLHLYAKWDVVDEYYYTEGLVFNYNNYDGYTVRYDVERGSNIRRTVEEIYVPAYYNDGVHGLLPVLSVGMDAFAYCNALTKVHLPETLTMIGQWAFRYCTSLESIELPDGLKTVHGDSFEDCTALKEIKVSENSENFKTVDGILYRKNGILVRCPAGLEVKKVVLEVGTVSVDRYAFSDNPYIEEVDLQGITEVPNYLFRDCTALKTVKIPQTVTSIGQGAFFGCTSMENITLPDGLLSLGGSAFNECRTLKSVTLPAGITAIEETIFLNCVELMEVVGLDKVTSIGDSAFSGCKMLQLTDLTAVETVGEYAFWKCTGVERVIFSNQVLFTGESVFGNWTEDQTICFEGLEYPLETWHEAWDKNSNAVFVYNYSEEA